MKRISVLLILLVLTSLACGLPIRAVFEQPTPTPQPIIPNSTEAAEVEGQLATAVAELENKGNVTVEFTESQLTSYIQQKIAAEPDSPIKDPQVRLQNGLIEITADATIGIFSSTATIILEPYADQGNLGVTIREAKFGSVPFPEKTLESLNQALNQNLNDLITLRGNKFYLETIEIDDGTLTLSGKLQ